jgi:hypothetical protein
MIRGPLAGINSDYRLAVHQFESRTISSMVQTWPAIPASIAGVTLKGLVNPSKVVPHVMQGNRMMQVINLF